VCILYIVVWMEHWYLYTHKTCGVIARSVFEYHLFFPFFDLTPCVLYTYTYKYSVIFSQVIKSKTAASRFEYQFILIRLPNDLLSYIVVMKLYKNRIDRIVFTFSNARVDWQLEILKSSPPQLVGYGLWAQAHTHNTTRVYKYNNWTRVANIKTAFSSVLL
jgi:hypothetical protein